MRNNKKIISFVLAIIMLVTLNSFTLMAYAEGMGTEDNPYLITTATELQNINSNPSAHYKLMANIDLKNADFTPIGNADSGAFSGSFDGNGYTISNLNVFSGKYAGLFGCNEGTIKNVILKDIYVYGTRYIGGVVGQNTSIGLVADCTVQSGKIESDGGLNNVNAGGICGSNEGSIEGSLSNSASVSVTVSSNGCRVGGIIGYNGKSISLTASNFGKIKCSVNSSAYSGYTGGLVAYSSASLIVADSYNKGNVTGSSSYYSYYSYVGGLLGYGYSTVTITNSYNTGDVTGSSSSDYSSYVGGLLGRGSSTVAITNSYNTGNVSSSDYAGGLVGYGSSTVTVTNSYNTGNVSSSDYAGGLVGYGNSTVTVTNSYNTGNVTGSSSSYVGGLVGCGNGSINACYNEGEISSKGGSNEFAGGIIGSVKGEIKIESSYNAGVVYSETRFSQSSNYYVYSGGIIGAVTFSVTSTYVPQVLIENCYNSGFIYSNEEISGSGGMVGYCTSKNQPVKIINCYNSGYCYSSTRSSCSVAFKGDSSSNNVTLRNFYSLFSVEREYSHYYSGYATGGCGNSLSYAEMKSQKSYENWDFDEIWQIDSNKNSGYPTLKSVENPLTLNFTSKVVQVGTYFNLEAYENNIAINDVDWATTYGSVSVNSAGRVFVSSTGYSIITAIDSSGNKVNCEIYAYEPASSISMTNRTINIANGKTSNKSYYSINDGSGDFIVDWSSSNESVATVSANGYLTPKSVGTTIITAKTAGGAVDTQIVTVVDTATSLSLSNSSVTIARGNTKQITATTTPSPTSSSVTWTSSDNNVATVDQNGNVTGVSIGSATITAKTDNGYSATCSVTVNAPVTSIKFVQPSVSVYKGYTVQLDVVTDPSDTTDAITYSSSSTTIATVSTSGVVTAKATGTATITATSASGKKAYCAITVLAAPVVVTDLTLGVDRKDMLIGELYTLSATITPSTATDKTIIWQTTNSDIVDVSETGVLTAKGAGKAIVSATTSSGITKYCVVNVAGVSDGAIARIFVPDISQTGVDYIDVPVIIENNPGISFASISVGYDANELEPIDVTNGTVFDSVTGSFDTDNNVVKLYFISEENKTADGNLAIIRFRVINTGAVETRVSVAYMPGGITNNAEEAVAFNLADGRVETELCIHENTEVRNAKTATCTEQGYTGDIYCLDCGDLLETGTALDITPHHYQTTVFEPTENKQGYTKYVCTDCGYSYVGNITDYASDNSVLIAILETIASYSEENYSADSFANLQAIYNKYSSMATGSYAQIEIDNAAFDLITAVSALEPYLKLNTSASNGTFTVTYNDETNSNFNHSLLFGTNVTLTATANEGYEFVGWYDTVNNLYFSKNSEYSFKLTTNTSLKAVFVNEQSATLTFTTYSNWVQSTVTKTIDEWNAVTSIDDLLPEVPYKYGYSNGRWVYDNAEVLAKLQTGENVSLIPEYDEDDTSLPTPPSPKGDTPVLDLYYKLDSEANVGSFVMAAGIPQDCILESVGVLFYYKNADEFDPTRFELLINNKMLAGRFNTDEIEDIYIVNMNKMSADKNWAARGYVTYYDSDGNLKTVYSNQINIVNREQV